MALGFLLKKLIGALLMPLPISMILACAALYYCVTHQLKKAKYAGITAVSLLLFFSLPLTSQFLIHPLEFRYPKLPLEDATYIAELQPDFIVVMGCWHSDDDQLPIVAKLDQCSLPRVVQAAQIWHQYPAAKLIFSGTAGRNGNLSDPAINAELAQALGVEQSKVILLEGSKDSVDEVNSHKKLVAGTRFIVVSSATHMKRLDMLYQSVGLTPIMSPSEYVSSHGFLTIHSFIPSASSLKQSERALYEYMGITWTFLKSLL